MHMLTTLTLKNNLIFSAEGFSALVFTVFLGIRLVSVISEMLRLYPSQVLLSASGRDGAGLTGEPWVRCYTMYYST